MVRRHSPWLAARLRPHRTLLPRLEPSSSCEAGGSVGCMGSNQSGDEWADVAQGTSYRCSCRPFCGRMVRGDRATELAIGVAHEFAEQTLDLEDEEVAIAFFHQAMVRRAAEESLSRLCSGRLSRAMTEPRMTEILMRRPQPETTWCRRVAGWATRSCKDGPLATSASNSALRFAAFLQPGWRICGQNSYECSRAVERLAAAAQVVLVELATEDLCLMPTYLDISVETRPADAADAGDTIQWRISEEGRVWNVTLTAPVSAEVSHKGARRGSFVAALRRVVAAQEQLHGGA